MCILTLSKERSPSWFAVAVGNFIWVKLERGQRHVGDRRPATIWRVFWSWIPGPYVRKSTRHTNANRSTELLFANSLWSPMAQFDLKMWNYVRAPTGLKIAQRCFISEGEFATYCLRRRTLNLSFNPKSSKGKLSESLIDVHFVTYLFGNSYANININK